MNQGSCGRAGVRGMVALALLALLGLLVWLEAPLCPSAALLGLPCPGCGLTRATLALLSGDFVGAHQHHPLVLVLAPIAFSALGAIAVSAVRGSAVRPPRSRILARGVTAGSWAILGLVVGVWLARFLGAFGGPAPVSRNAPLTLLIQTLNRK